MFPYVNTHTHQIGEGIHILNLDALSPTFEPGDVSSPTDDTLFYSIGIHPLCLEEHQEVAWQNIASSLQHPRVIAIGECGLDRRGKTPIALQLALLSKHLQLATQARKPLIIHCVKAYSELIAWHKSLSPSVPCIIHGYNNNLHILSPLLAHHFYISFGPALLQPHSNASQVISHVPLTSLFLETDDKETPIDQVYHAASQWLNIPLAKLRQQLWENYTTTFSTK